MTLEVMTHDESDIFIRTKHKIKNTYICVSKIRDFIKIKFKT
jgi:hypothetical protein